MLLKAPPRRLSRRFLAAPLFHAEGYRAAWPEFNAQTPPRHAAATFTMMRLEGAFADFAGASRRASMTIHIGHTSPHD